MCVCVCVCVCVREREREREKDRGREVEREIRGVFGAEFIQLSLLCRPFQGKGLEHSTCSWSVWRRARRRPTSPWLTNSDSSLMS